MLHICQACHVLPPSSPSWSIIAICTLPFPKDVAISRLRGRLRTSQDAAGWAPDGPFGIDVGISTFDGAMRFTQGSHVGRLTWLVVDKTPLKDMRTRQLG